MNHKTVCLLGCSKQKAPNQTTAENLYQGVYFKKALEYAKHKNGDILVLSAKHYVLKLSDIVAPYDLTLIKMSSKECREWATIVRKQLMEKGYNLQKDYFVFLTGKNYYQNLVPYMTNYEIVGEGKSIGQKLHELDKLNNQFKQ